MSIGQTRLIGSEWVQSTHLESGAMYEHTEHNLREEIAEQIEGLDINDFATREEVRDACASLVRAGSPLVVSDLRDQT